VTPRASRTCGAYYEQYLGHDEREAAMGKRILLVEDDAQNSYLIRFILERSGYTVVSVGDGVRAVEAAASESPDLVLMDMLLPRMNGYDATRAIKADPDTAEITVIALTAYSMKGDRERILEAGCEGYISKPIDPETFVSQMEEFLPAG
jgi:two-component system cell cycle response regulator DivK